MIVKPIEQVLSKGRLTAALKRSLKHLGMNQVDLYQIHAPIPPVPIETWADGLAAPDAVNEL